MYTYLFHIFLDSFSGSYYFQMFIKTILEFHLYHFYREVYVNQRIYSCVFKYRVPRIFSVCPISRSADAINCILHRWIDGAHWFKYQSRLAIRACNYPRSFVLVTVVKQRASSGFYSREFSTNLATTLRKSTKDNKWRKLFFSLNISQCVRQRSNRLWRKT